MASLQLEQTTLGGVPLDIEDFTKVDIKGDGVFDKLLQTFRIHLQEEFDKNRIVGKQYSDAFIQGYLGIERDAIELMLAKEKQALEIKLLESQIAGQEKQNQLIDAQIAGIVLDNVAKDFNNTKMLPEQLAQIIKENDILDVDRQTKGYNLDFILPAQLQNMLAEKLQTEAQTGLIGSNKLNVDKDTAVKNYQLTYVMPKELERVTAEVGLSQANKSKVEYEVASLLPAQLQNMTKQNSLLDAQAARTIAETADVTKGTELKDYQLGFVLPSEVARNEAENLRINADTDRITMEVTKIPYEIQMLQAALTKIPAEVALLNKQVTKIDKDIELQTAQISLQLKQVDLAEKQILMAAKELLLKDKQLELQTAEIAVKNKQLDLLAQQILQAAEEMKLMKQKVITEQAQTDPAVVKPGSVIDKQNKVLDAQTTAYANDNLHKLATLMVNSWMTRRNTDEAEAADGVNKLDNDYIGAVLTKAFTAAGVPTPP